MKARKNPTIEQLARRLSRSPLSRNDPRIKNDGYWALRAQGYPASYAKRAFRNQPPVIHQHIVSADLGEYACDPDDILFPPGSTWTEIEVKIRPELTEDAIVGLKPLTSEYTVWDHLVPSFGIRVRTSGHMSYIVCYRIRPQKRSRKFTIGRPTEFSLEQARDVARKFRRQARMGSDPKEKMHKRPNQV